MRKKSFKNLFISLLIALAMLANANVVLAAKTKSKKGKNSDNKKVAVEKKEGVVKKAITEIKYTGFEAKRNPFAPPKVVSKMLEKTETIDGFERIESVKVPKIDVQGIIWSKFRPQVIINGDVMSQGDYIQEFQIKEVTKNGIILFYKGKDYLMKMQNYQNKKKKIKKKR